ncbi:MAG: protein kinase, partial [Symploca sp. SIO1A3]|nr:protein kinase [Symploca sp. SIO1A3]
MINCATCGEANPDTAQICSACGTPLTQPEPTTLVQKLPVGTKLQKGNYSVGKVLGQGGFGITYLGSDVRKNRPVAVKEFFLFGSCTRQGKTVQSYNPSDYQNNRQKFLEEAQLLSQFNHPGIVQVDTCFEENNTAYMIMEFVKGKTLAQILVEEGGVLAEQKAVRYICRAAEALDIVHQADVLHRDLKPDNIIVSDDGRVVLIDFGAARQFVADKTKTHSVILTQGYAPPEQGTPRAQRGPFTDIYALGATLYHLLTGELPIPATERLLNVDLIPPNEHDNSRSVSQTVSKAVMWAMTIKVNERPQSVTQFIEALTGQRKAPKQNATTATTLQFNNNESAASIEDLIELCDKYLTQAQDFLFNRYIEQWLAGSLGRTDLAQQTRQITNDYDTERRKGLELFVRQMCLEAEIEPYPELFTQPSRLDIGSIPVGTKQRIPLKLGNRGRGFAWGTVSLTAKFPGLLIQSQFERPTETLALELDTLQVKPGTYQGEIIIQGEQIPTSCRVPIQYTVKPITIDIPSELDLGVVSYGEQISRSFKVRCTPAGGKIKATAFTDGTGLHLTDKSIQLQVDPSAHSSLNLEGSRLYLCLALDTRSLEAGRQYQRKVSFQTNAGDYQIPVKFKITVPSDIIVR